MEADPVVETSAEVVVAVVDVAPDADVVVDALPVVDAVVDAPWPLTVVTVVVAAGSSPDR